MTGRTPTPELDGIWSREATIRRWHLIWRVSLAAQTMCNPHHSGVAEDDLINFEIADESLRNQDVMAAYLDRVDQLERTTGHDLVAALYAYIELAGADSIHMGLTSHDVVDPANQMAIHQSLGVLIGHAAAVAKRLAAQAKDHADTRLVARTHGQPAQLTTVGHRYGTILGPLLDWIERAEQAHDRYKLRPQLGAVGTGADLSRVLAERGGGLCPNATVASPLFRGVPRDERQPIRCRLAVEHGGDCDYGIPGSPLEATGSASEGPAGTETPPGVSEAPERRRRCREHVGRRRCLMPRFHEPVRIQQPALSGFSVLVDGHVYLDRQASTESQPTLTSDVKCRDASTGSDGAPQAETGDDGGILTRRVAYGYTSYIGEERPDVSHPDGHDQSTSVDDEPSKVSFNPSLKISFNIPRVGHDEYQQTISDGLFPTQPIGLLDATRQVYHRSIDLDVAGLLAQLASIAQTFANDRRLESMLGLGGETGGTSRVGSSAMAHKSNPVLAERICSLAVIARGDLSVCSELAGMEWLEGDVSGSAARRLVLPRMFQNIDAILSNWWHLMDRWHWDLGALRIEIDRYAHQLATGALLQAGIDAGGSRQEVYEAIRKAASGPEGWGRRSNTIDPFRANLGANPDYPLWSHQLRRVIDEVLTGPIGYVHEQIERLVRLTNARLVDKPYPAWQPEMPR